MPYEAVIGLEVHAELLTESKIFCGCSAKFGAPPNQNTCPVCLGMPGVLPVLNRRVVEFAIRAGLATHCAIAPLSRWARKNYFYPDLPKGYQISQYELPICLGGWIDIEIDGDDAAPPPDAHPHGRGRRQEHPRRARRCEPGRLQPLRRAAARDRQRARHALARGGRGLPAQAAHDPAVPRDLRRQHGGGQLPLRRQRLRPPARRRANSAPRSKSRT